MTVPFSRKGARMMFLILQSSSLLLLSISAFTPPTTSIAMSIRRSRNNSPSSSSSSTTLKGVSQNSMERREAIVSASLILVAAGAFGVAGASISSSNVSIPPVPSAAPTLTTEVAAGSETEIVAPLITRLDSVQQAIDVIESSCDRRFLQAIAATEFHHLLYRGIPSSSHVESFPTIRREPCDLLDPATCDSTAAADFFWHLERSVMKGKPVRPSNGHLAVTSHESAAVWGGAAASIWPLGPNVHFGWLPNGGEFWPSPAADDDNERPVGNVLREVEVIVDGIDCGRLSLEDALERENSEIMFRAEKFLAVPKSLEKEFVSQLRSAFII